MVQLTNVLFGLTMVSMVVAAPVADRDIAPAANYRRLPEPQHGADWQSDLVKKNGGHGGPGHGGPGHDHPYPPGPTGGYGFEKRWGWPWDHHDHEHPHPPGPTGGYGHEKRWGGHDHEHEHPRPPGPTGYGKNSFIKRDRGHGGDHDHGHHPPSPTGGYGKRDYEHGHPPKPTGGYEHHTGYDGYNFPQLKQKN